MRRLIIFPFLFYINHESNFHGFLKKRITSRFIKQKSCWGFCYFKLCVFNFLKSAIFRCPLHSASSISIQNYSSPSLTTRFFSNTYTMLRKNSSLLLDAVTVKDLQFNSIVSNENKSLFLTADLYTNFAKAGSTDDLKYSINYAVLSRNFKEFEQNHKKKNFLSIVDLGEKLFQDVVFENNCSIGSLSIKCKEPNYEYIVTLNRELKNGAVAKSAAHDQIEILNISLNTIIGIFTFERFKKQPVVLDVSIDIDLSNRNLAPDKINSSIGKFISDYVENSNFKTVEALVLNVTRLVYEIIPETLDCKVGILKTDILDYTNVGVSSTRNKDEIKEIESDVVKFNKSDITTDKFMVPNLNSETIHQEDNEIKNHSVYLAFGSNIGHQLNNINEAIDELNSHPEIKVLQTSSLYKSKPMYYLDQPDFINGCLKITTTLSPLDLLKILKDIEYNRLNRVKKFDNGPRTIDLDILLYDTSIINLPQLNIPHIRMIERSFVLVPLCELLPVDFIHPVTAEPIHDHLNQLNVNAPSPDIQESSDLITIIPLPTRNDSKFRYLEYDLVYNKTKTQLMSILNITPDSFSDGSIGNLSLNNIMEKVEDMVSNNVDIIDIGGCSTRPGSKQPSEEEELKRVIPVIKMIKEKFGSKVILSVDTYRSKVAEESIKLGADIINDISGGLFDSRMYSVVARYGVPYIVNHTRGDIKTMSALSDYSATGDGNIRIFNERVTKEDTVVVEVSKELSRLIEKMYSENVKRWQLILDPGLGFAKRLNENLSIIRDLPYLKTYKQYNPDTGCYISFDYIPVLLGPSRKKFIGTITGKETASERVNGTSASITAGIGFGADIVRVHDYKEMKDVCLMCDAIYKGLH